MVLCCPQYTVHTIPTEGGGLFPFVLIDTIGLERKQPTEEIVKLALRGHLRSGFEVRRSVKQSCRFQPLTASACFFQFKPGEDILRDPFYKHNPDAADQVDVAVCVCPMDVAFPLDDRTLNGMQAIALEARDLSESCSLPPFSSSSPSKCSGDTSQIPTRNGAIKW